MGMTAQEEILQNKGFEILCGDSLTDPAHTRLLSDRVALHLAARGIRPGEVVAMKMPGTEKALILLTGILKAGAAAVPISTVTPMKRTEDILRISGAALLLEENDFVSLSGEIGGSADTLPRAAEEDTALILFTSGSTGNPKGVCHSQRSLRAMLHAIPDCLRQEDCVPAVTIYDTDMSFVAFFMFEYATTLFSTGRACIPASNAERTLAAAAEGLRHHCAALSLQTSKCKAYLRNDEIRERIGSLSALFLGGEMVEQSLLERLRLLCPDTLILPVYGSSECGVIAAEKAGGTLMKPVSGVIIADEAGQPCPVRAVGEICVDNARIFSGYLGGEEKRLIPLHGKDYFPTGDMGRLDGEGLQIIGRKDHMVKWHGYRVELGEIEHKLRAHPAVDNAALVYTGEEIVAICAVGEKNESLTERIRDDLSEELPYYMIPSRFILLDVLPVNARGKTDREALRQLAQRKKETDGPREEEREQSGSPETALLLDGLEAVLGVRASPRDSAAELGLESLKGLLLADWLEEQGYRLRLSDMLLHPVIETMAQYMKGIIDEHESRARAERKDGDWEFIIQNPFEWLVLNTERSGMGTPPAGKDELPFGSANRDGLLIPAWRMDELFLARVDFTEEAFLEKARQIMLRHPALRSSFSVDANGRARQRILEEPAGELHYFDIERLRGAECERISEKQRSYIRFFRRLKIEEGAMKSPVLMACFRLGGGTCALWLSLSHAVADGVCMALIKGELLTERGPGQLSDAYIAYREWSADPEIRKMSRQFFREALRGAVPAAAPLSPNRFRGGVMETRKVVLGNVRETNGLSPSSYAAWRYGKAALDTFGGDCVFFLIHSSGRNIPLRGIADTVGCLAAGMPVVIRRDDTPQRFVRRLYEAERHTCMTAEELFGRLSPVTLPSLESLVFPDRTEGRDLGPLEAEAFSAGDFSAYITIENGELAIKLHYHAEPEQRAFYREFARRLSEK